MDPLRNSHKRDIGLRSRCNFAALAIDNLAYTPFTFVWLSVRWVMVNFAARLERS